MYFGNVDHKRQPLYSIFSRPYVVVFCHWQLQMIFISQVVLINSFSKIVFHKSWIQTMFYFVYFNH